MSEFRAAFDLFDKDGNGSISKEELGLVMKNLGLGPSDEDLRDIIREHDIDRMLNGSSSTYTSLP